jgi:hypothetical protein
VTNQIEVSAQPPSGSRISSLSDDNNYGEHDATIAYLGNKPSIGLIKTFDHIQQANPAVTQVGDTIFYNLTVVKPSLWEPAIVTATSSKAKPRAKPVGMVPMMGLVKLWAICCNSALLISFRPIGAPLASLTW